MPVKISVILPTFNMASFIGEAINSILKNKFKDVEIIVLDDGSTDNTAKIVKGFKVKEDIPILYHKVTHRGKSASINEIFKNITINGDYIVFMDADDILPPQSLQQRFEAIHLSEADLVIGQFAVTNLEGKVKEIREIHPNVSRKDFMKEFLYSSKTPFHLNGAIISKELLLKTGPFDESLVRGQEVDYSIRLLQAADNIKIIPKVVYHYRKYHRTIKEHLKIRLQTMYYRVKWINKHANGLRKIRAVATQLFFDVSKLVYVVFQNYA